MNMKTEMDEQLKQQMSDRTVHAQKRWLGIPELRQHLGKPATRLQVSQLRSA